MKAPFLTMSDAMMASLLMNLDDGPDVSAFGASDVRDKGSWLLNFIFYKASGLMANGIHRCRKSEETVNGQSIPDVDPIVGFNLACANRTVPVLFASLGEDARAHPFYRVVPNLRRKAQRGGSCSARRKPSLRTYEQDVLRAPASARLDMPRGSNVLMSLGPGRWACI